MQDLHALLRAAGDRRARQADVPLLPPYREPGLRHLRKAERPDACRAYACAYLAARLADSPERNRIPHPLEAGAYFHRDPQERAIVLFVDPAKPELWKRSAIPDLLRPALERGETLVVFDRGRQMTITSLPLFEAVLQRDMVGFAESEGRALDVPSFAEWQAG